MGDGLSCQDMAIILSNATAWTMHKTSLCFIKNHVLSHLLGTVAFDSYVSVLGLTFEEM
jgi:hypothetical protein